MVPTYKYKQLLIRIKYNTFKRLKKVFPARRYESMVRYFERLAKKLEKDRIEVLK